MLIVETMRKKLLEVTDRITHFRLLVEGYHTPKRGPYMGQPHPLAMDLMVEMSQLLGAPELIVAGTISMETVVTGVDLHGEVKLGIPLLKEPEAAFYFNNPETGESCRLQISINPMTLLRWETRELHLEGALYADGEYHSEVSLTIPLEQAMRLYGRERVSPSDS